MKYYQYTCKRCDVQWRAAEDENVPDKCWWCERSDAVSVWTQAGQPVALEEGDKPATEQRQWINETRVGVL